MNQLNVEAIFCFDIFNCLIGKCWTTSIYLYTCNLSETWKYFRVTQGTLQFNICTCAYSITFPGHTIRRPNTLDGQSPVTVLIRWTSQWVCIYIYCGICSSKQRVKRFPDRIVCSNLGRGYGGMVPPRFLFSQDPGEREVLRSEEGTHTFSCLNHVHDKSIQCSFHNNDLVRNREMNIGMYEDSCVYSCTWHNQLSKTTSRLALI